MNEQVFLGGRRIAAFGLRDVGVGDVGDLLAYRQEWEPFIFAHIALWQRVNELLESIPEAQRCPSGIFTASQIQNLDSTTQAFCASLDLSRIRTSATDPGGILDQWNAWKDKSSGEIVAGAATMLAWHQDVVMRVGGSYKDELLQIAQLWKIDITLPDVPSFSTQQEIIARIEGAYITTKGVVQIIGYGVGETVMMAANATQAVAEGLVETAKKLPTAASSALKWVAVTAVIVAGGLVVYYHPRRERASA